MPIKLWYFGISSNLTKETGINVLQRNEGVTQDFSIVLYTFQLRGKLCKYENGPVDCIRSLSGTCTLHWPLQYTLY